MPPSFQHLLAENKRILYDGATGTFLQELGLPLRAAPEKWVLENPAQVFTAAQAYVNAGSQIILTCTFGGTTFRLAEAGLDTHAHRINRTAAELAKQAAGERALVAGSIGPLGVLSLSFGTVTYEEAVEQFATQASALKEGGVDLFQIESMSDLSEVSAAVEGVRRVCELPIAVTLTFDQSGRTLLGVTPLVAARELAMMRVTVMGANCGSGPENIAGMMRAMRSGVNNATLIAKPNAGLPTAMRGKLQYSIDPRRFAEYGREWVAAGAKIIGGCCGSNPEYIRELATVI